VFARVGILRLATASTDMAAEDSQEKTSVAPRANSGRGRCMMPDEISNWSSQPNTKADI